MLRKTLLLLFCLFSVFFAARAESFRNPRRIPLTVDPYGLTTGDLNGDGRRDIVWIDKPAYPGTSMIHVLLANASGQYVSAPDVSLPFAPGFIQCVIEDVTSDERNDLVCLATTADNSQAFLFAYVGNGDGTFGAPVQTKITGQPVGSAPILAATGDLNGDGRPDVLVTSAYNSQILPYLSDGHGGFKQGTPFNGSFNYSVPTVTDLNGDGKLDVLWSTGPRVNLGHGDGSFTAPAQYDPGYLSNCAFGDVDHDGHLDAVCTWFPAGGDLAGYLRLTVLHGNADGSFDKKPLFERTFGDKENEYDGLPTIYTPMYVTDLNGDGYADIISISGDGYSVLLGGPGITWNGQPQQFVTASAQLNGSILAIYGVSVADMNGDGLPDIVSVGPNGIYITYGQKDGTLSSAPAVELGEVSTGSTLVDVNGDGNLDAVSAGDTALKLSLGHGDGTFGPPQAITTTGNFGDVNYVAPWVLSGDFNGDGKQDLLAIGSTSAYQTQTYVIYGHGDGTFDSPKPVGAAIAYGKVADLNGDGRSDVISIQTMLTNPATTSVLLASVSKGDGTFQTVSTTLPADTAPNGSTYTPSGPALADFTHSGHLDAAVVTMSNVHVLRGHGDGSFETPGTALAIPDLPNLNKVGGYDVTTGDFDGDGKIDIAVVMQYGSGTYNLSTPTSAAWVFYGKGDGTFSTAVPAGTFNRDAFHITAGDLNGDGLADLVLTADGVYQDMAVMIVHALPNRAWGPETDYAGGVALSPMWITDINHDGRNDLIFSNAKSLNFPANSISVLLGLDATAVSGTVTASPEPSNVTYPFTLHASLVPSNASDVLSGVVTFSLDGVVVGTGTLSGNAASLNVTGTNVAAGSHSISASWPGDATYPPVVLNGTHVVSLLPLNLSLVATPTSLSAGGTVNATVTFGMPIAPNGGGVSFSGAVTLLDNGVAMAQQPAVAAGVSFSLSTLTVGTHVLSVTYPGDAVFAAAQSNTVTVTVQGAATTATLTASPAVASYGAPVMLTAKVSSATAGTLTGTVAFYADGALLGSSVVANGVATFTTTSLHGGARSLTCSYSGDATFAASDCAPVSVTVQNAATALVLTASSNPMPALSTVTFTANLTAQGKAFAAAVAFYVDGVAVKTVTVDANGNATYATTLAVGSHSVRAEFTGSDGYDASNASLTEVAVANPTTTTLAPPTGPVYVNQPFALTAAVTATTGTARPNGTVVLTEGSAVLGQTVTQGSVPGSTVATVQLTAPALAVGTHLLVATYTPVDGNFLGSVSQTISAVVAPQTFTLSLSADELSIVTEHHKPLTATLQSIGAFTGMVQLTCVVPQNVYLSCTIGHSQLMLAANGSADTELIVDTDILLRFKSSREGGESFGARGLVVALLLPLGLLLRRRVRVAPLLLLLLVAMAGVSGCSDKYPAHTPPGSYDVVITATGTSAGATVAVSHTVHVPLTVTAE